MSEHTAYPLSWPLGIKRTPAGARKSANFSSMERVTGQYGSWRNKRQITIAEAKTRLLDEIGKFTKTGHTYRVDPSRVVISSNQVLNRDGSIRSTSKAPEDPGVAVYFTLDGKPYCLPCDRWNRVADNLAAIAAHLCAMRGMERWGVGTIEQAFTGYLALEHKTEPTCWEILEISSDVISNLSRSDAEACILLSYRTKAKKAHPDAGGTSEEFSALTRAKDVALQSL